MTAIDKTGKTVKTDEDGLVRVDGITAFRRIEREGVVYIQFCDRDRMRIQCRGTKFVEIPLSILIQKLTPQEPTPTEIRYKGQAQ